MPNEAQNYLQTRHIMKVKVFAVVVFLSFLLICFYGQNEIETNVNTLAKIRRDANRFRPRQQCNCKGYENNSEIETVRSTCSAEASEAGLNQNVVSYSYFIGTPTEGRNYTAGIQGNLETVREFYPNWLMRVYTNVSLTNELCNMVCENEDFYLCPVEYADTLGIGNVSEECPAQWRFLVLGDDTVQKFLLRDLDSRISEREVDAVKEWEKSSKIFHAMRDHPGHTPSMLAGMWGGDNMLLGSDTKSLQQKIVMNREFKKGCVGIDQTALEIHIYPYQRQHQMLIHDSYHCEKFNDSVPFPTQREKPDDFVGSAFDFDYKLQMCPKNCRPSYGQDWLYC